MLMRHLEVHELCEAMTRIAEDVSLRRQLSEQGLAHSKNFSWERTATETLAVLEEAAQMDREEKRRE